MFLVKDVLQFGLKTFMWLKKLKILCHGHMLLTILMVKKLLECIMKKKNSKNNQTEVIIEKVIKKKGDKLYVRWKGYDHSLDW